ncbi:tyrosine-type recombinase/integrase [Pseudofrankia inefficax]|uniref:Integrase family protein n=1 Tax=Pseudofrankia inefficax (strain DSM 45817 / CECT 9037 / DDB 130130 / EuI1c) TaxID=298654 RepID=E3J756_PSEI1|nr:tyrosine-type recombinase/integrase [Pseudofrankia inefficax]ADP84420.1 integrase family protein [Pseudofrankia inefficax]
MSKPFRKCWCRDPQTKREYRRGQCPDYDRKGHAKWYGRLEAPKGATGRRRQPLIGPFDSEKEAKLKLAAAVGRTAGGTYSDDQKITFAQYADRRLEWREATAATGEGLKRSTLDAEHEALTLYLKPGLGHLRLVEIRDRHVRDLYAAMRLLNRDEAAAGELAELVRRLADARAVRDGKRIHNRPLSESRIRRIHAVLTGILNDAVKLAKILDANPAEDIFRSAGGAKRRGRARPLLWSAERTERWVETGHVPGKVMVWAPAQCGAFLDFSEASGERLHALFHLDAYYGPRRGELVGLERSDLSIERRRLHVRQADTDGDLDEGKTENADRMIVFDEDTAAVLKAERKRQAAERLHWGEAYEDSGRVFTREDGTALRPANVSERFAALVTRYGAIRTRLAKPGWTPERTAAQFRVPIEAVQIAAESGPLPPIRFHDLRHGAATMLLASGAEMKLVSDVLGHASAAFTSDVYAVVAEELAEAAAVRIAAFVPRHNKIKAVGASNVPARGINGS